MLGRTGVMKTKTYFFQVKVADAKPIAPRNRTFISLRAGYLLPRRERTATQDSIVYCPIHASFGNASHDQGRTLRMNTESIRKTR